MKIYFAHSMHNYKSDYEKKCKNQIEVFCKESGIDNYDIINPIDFNIEKIKLDKRVSEKEFSKLLDFALKTHFYPIINECNMIAFFPDNMGHWTDGVIKELIFSLKKKKKLLIFDNVFNNTVRGTNSDLVMALIRNIKYDIFFFSEPNKIGIDRCIEVM